MGTEFTPIFLFGLLAVAMALSIVALATLIGPKKITAVKQMPYESGMDPVGDARQRFDIRYYVVAIVFLLFDVELLFLYPWAAAHWGIGSDSGGAVVAASAPAEPGAGAVAGVVGGGVGIAAAGAVEDEGGASATARRGYSDVVGSGVGVYPENRTLVFFVVAFLVVILTLADVYAWRKGVFEWR